MPNKKINKQTDFSKLVYEFVRQIPAGKTRSYKEVAVAVNNPKASRAVAQLMAKNYDENIPCHRVIRSDGSPGGYNRGGEKVKARLLVKEGCKL